MSLPKPIFIALISACAEAPSFGASLSQKSRVELKYFLLRSEIFLAGFPKSYPHVGVFQLLTGTVKNAVEIVNPVLTILAIAEILFKLYVAFLLDREVLLFDNRYDVPESVRNQSRFSSPIGLSKSSDNNSLGRLAL
jgi:hypothetical protein